MSQPFTNNAPGAQIDVNVPVVDLGDLDLFPHKIPTRRPSFYDRVGRKLEITGTGFAGSLPDDGMPPTVTITNGVVSTQYFHSDDVSVGSFTRLNVKLKKATTTIQDLKNAVENKAQFIDFLNERDRFRNIEIDNSLILRAAYWLYRKTSI